MIGVALSIGSVIGAYAGLYGGIIDEILMRITDVFFALPALILAISVAVVLGPGVEHMALALIIVW